MTMTINSLTITKITYGDKKGEYTASCAVDGDNPWEPSIKITLQPDDLLPIVRIIEVSVAEAMASAAKAFAEDVQASITGPIIDQKSIETEKTA